MNNPEIKKDLIKLGCSYSQTGECGNLFEIPLTINRGEIIWSITKETIEVFPISNREEADRTLIFHEGMSNEAAIIAAKDGDVFLLLIYALGQLEYFLPYRI